MDPAVWVRDGPIRVQRKQTWRDMRAARRIRRKSGVYEKSKADLSSSKSSYRYSIGEMRPASVVNYDFES